MSPSKLPLNLLLLTLFAVPAAAQQVETEPIDFNRQIRPILSENCFLCHGFDISTRKGELRLDIFDGAIADRGGYAAIQPGNLEDSELWYRINTEYKKEVMPPTKTGKTLTAEQKGLLKRWIEGGAKYTTHWAFVPPKEKPAPEAPAEWQRNNDIDAFIQNELQGAGMQPASQADRNTLIRRVTLDLTGLPPTPEEVAAFLADPAANAYEKVVNRLLTTSAYAEHMTRFWLDAARYGDTHGLHLDNYRSMYRYRDWLIQAYQQNMPYDQFVTEQLAGDLMPEPTLDQRLATGFVRCNATSAEGGMIAEEFLAKYAMDRVDTFGTVFMGMSIACAQCHDHKFDPVTQEEYYKLFAFFNNIAEDASDKNIAAPAPIMRAPYPEQVEQLAVLEQKVSDQRAILEAPMPEADAAQADWVEEQTKAIASDWFVPGQWEMRSHHGSELVPVAAGYILAQGPNPDKEVFELDAQLPAGPWSAFRLEVEPDQSTPTGGVGRSTNGNVVMSGVELEYSFPGSARFHRIELVQAVADHQQKDYGTAGVLDLDQNSGWALLPEPNKRHTMVLQAIQAIQAPKGMTLRVRLKFESVHKQHVIGKFRLSATQNPDYQPVVGRAWQQSQFFAADSGAVAFETEYGPELTSPSNEIEWTEHPEYEDGALHMLQGDVGVVYLQRELISNGSQKIELSLGSDDAIKVWLNGELVVDENVQRALALDQNQVMLNLQDGVNHLLYKVVNYGGGFGYTFKLLNQEPGGVPLVVQQLLAHAGGNDGGQSAASSPAPSEAEELELRNYFRRNFSPQWKEQDAVLQQLLQDQAALDAKIPVTLVAEERQERRPARLLNRGQYDDPGQEVQPGTPGLLPPLIIAAPVEASAGAEKMAPRASRLDLARWLFREDHPLTARVHVNRLWQMLFGTGLVRTAGDFGAQGEWPSHPALLDWLALEFQRADWDQHALIRMMVTSATYMQDSTWDPAKAEVDSENRLLARGPRFRLDAEVIRDSALASSGLLVNKVGGPSVKPYQPDGLWKAVGYTSSNTAKFAVDKGDDLYRRSLYTFWKRTSPPPTMSLFDAPTRESCIVQRERTNTPLQALALWNDVQYVEAARMLAAEMMSVGTQKKPKSEHDPGASIREGTFERGLRFAYQRVLARDPEAKEVEVLRNLLLRQIEVFAADTEGAKQLMMVGEASFNSDFPVVELAAWTSVASVILNLDETVTRR